MADAPLADAGRDAGVPSDSATDVGPAVGNCAPVSIAGCPNVVRTIGMEFPYALRGMTLDGHGNDTTSRCGDPGLSDWTLEFTVEEAGLLEVVFSSAAAFSIALQDGGCGGNANSCGTTNSTTTSTGVSAGQTLALTIEAATSCSVPFDLTVTLRP